MKLLKKHVFLILALCWTAMIFGFSLQDATGSNVSSNFVLNFLATFIPTLKEPQVMMSAILIIRKLAHFTEYVLLGLLYTKAQQETKWDKLLILGCLVPLIDETIQLFVPGRSGAVVDMLIDLSGYLTGLLILRSLTVLLKTIRISKPGSGVEKR